LKGEDDDDNGSSKGLKSKGSKGDDNNGNNDSGKGGVMSAHRHGRLRSNTLIVLHQGSCLQYYCNISKLAIGLQYFLSCSKDSKQGQWSGLTYELVQRL